MKQFQVGLIGFGKSAEIFHAPFITRQKGLVLRSILERTTSKSKSKYPGVRLVRNIPELLTGPDLDLVVITSPNITHYELARECLLNGKNVVVEKPFTVTAAQAAHLMELADSANLVLTVYHNRRLDGDFRTVKKIISDRLLGTILQFESHFDRYRPELKRGSWKEESLPGSGILYDLGAHLIDQALQLFGSPESLQAEIARQREESRIDDYFRLVLKYRELNCVLTAGMMNKDSDLRFRIKGTSGEFIKKGLDPQEIDMINGKDPQSSDWGGEREIYYGKLLYNDSGSQKEVIIPTINGNYSEFYQNLYDVLTNKAKILIKAEEAANVIRIIELAYESSAKGCDLPVLL